MQYAIYTIPVVGGEEQQEALNKFLRSHKIIKVDKEVVNISGDSYWSFCITYMQLPAQLESSQPAKDKIDYKNVLDEKAFKMFSDLRALRKQIAQNDAVPAYAVFTDAELATMTSLPSFDVKTMLSIDGIGSKRMEKYGKIMVDMYNATFMDINNEEGR